MQNKRNQMGKSKYCIRHLHDTLEKVKDVKQRSLVVQGDALGEGITCEGRTEGVELG